MAAGPHLSPASLVGRILDGRYELFDYIESGEITHVFRAWDGRLQHLVAVKILQERLAREPHMIAAFEEGARRAAVLPRHPHITQIHDIGRDGELAYVVTEFIAGPTLRQIIANEAPLVVERAFRLMRQAAQAVAFAHQYGLHHGDLHPGNVMMGERDDIKITDFGLARSIEMADLGRTHPMIERSPYLAPTLTTDRADVYALGAMLYEMLAGQPPSVAETPTAIGQADAVPDIRQVNQSVSPAAAAVLVPALALRPDRAYDDAGAFALAIQEYLVHRDGDTDRRVPLPQTQDPGAAKASGSSNAGSKKSGSMNGAKPAAAPFYSQYPRHRTRTGWRPWATLAFLATIAVALAGGWYAYRAIWHLLNGSSTTTTHQSRARVLPRGSRPRTAPARSTHLAAQCGVGIGPLRLANIWAHEVHPTPGQAVTFDYTLANGAPRCQRVLLALTASTSNGVPLTDNVHQRVVNAAPGTHLYQRQFTFPATSAGQVYTITLSAEDPSGRTVYGQIRVPNLITVGAA